MKFLNLYKCPCGEEWEDLWDCACNDKCPQCNKEIEPYYSEEIDTSCANADIKMRRAMGVLPRIYDLK
jgi:hypothetical protein